MASKGGSHVRGRLPILLLTFVCLGLVTGCDDDEVINLGGIDCGLIRDDLFGDWTADYSGSVARTLTNCTGVDPGVEGTEVDVSATAVIYTNADVLGSSTSPSFQVIADRVDGGDDVLVDDEFRMNIGADSCQAFVWLWEIDDLLYLQCIGTFDRGSDTLLASCDSAEVDTDGLGGPDTSCSLNATVDVAVSVN